MATQGGSHEQHVKAGQQTHKNAGASSSSSNDDKSGNSARGGKNEQQSKAGEQSLKNSK